MNRPLVTKYLIYIFVGISFIYSLFFFIKNTVPQFGKPLASSEDGYSRLASGIAESSSVTRVSNDYVWPPLTKILFSWAYLAHPSKDYMSVRYFSWAMIVIVIVSIGLITFRLTQSYIAGIFGVCLAATNPLLNYLSTITLSENIWLALVGLSIFFILGTNKKQWYVGFFFWGLSGACRYESWYLSPLIILIFWFYHHQLRHTLHFIYSCLFFPVYWLFDTFISTGNLFFYMNEKLRQAGHGPADIYHHFVPSLLVWLKNLHLLFDTSIVFVFLLGIFQNIRKKNFLFLLPIFIFASLVLQVYFATMEYFPVRYLAILPITVIPLGILAIFSNSAPKQYQALIAITLLVLTISSTDRNIHQFEELVQPEIAEVGQYVSRIDANCVNFVKVKDSLNFNDSAFWYFSQKPLTEVIYINSFNSRITQANCQVIVTEKGTVASLYKNMTFENKYYQVFEPYGR